MFFVVGDGVCACTLSRASGEGRWALLLMLAGATVRGRRMGDDVFSSKRPLSDDAGRVLVVGLAWQQIRLRNEPIWCGCHWINESVLCGGQLCPACKAGYSKRPYAFAHVDRPNQTTAIIRLSASDVCELQRTGSDSTALILGDSWKIRRPGERKPLVAEFFKSFPEFLPIPQENLTLEVLRLHRIRATAADVRERAYYGLICARAEEACGGRRLQLQ